MLYGAGQLMLLSKELNDTTIRGENLVHPLSIASFSLAFEDNNIEAKALIDGRRQIVGAAISESIATLTLTFEYADWNTLAMAYDEIGQASTAVKLPQLRAKTAVLATGGLTSEVLDADIAGTEEIGTDILAYVASRGTWGDRRYLTAAEVTVAAGKLELGSEFAGAVIQYSIEKEYSSIETIGLEADYDSFGKLYFTGVVAGTEFGRSGMGIVVPELNRISTPEITVNGDLSEMTVEFRASVPPGQRRAFQLYKLDGATAAA